MSTIFTLETKPGYTIEDYNKLPETDIKIELINGVFHMIPIAGGRHQRINTILRRKFESALPDNLDVSLPVGLKSFNNDTVLVPDLLIGYKYELLKDQTYFPPNDFLLVVEIESKSSKATDRITKYEAYEEVCIRCYVRIAMDDVDNPEVYVYELDSNNKYKEVSHAKSGEILNIYNPVKLSFNPKELIS